MPRSEPQRRAKPDRDALDARIAALVMQIMLQAALAAHDYQPSWEDFKQA